MWKILAEFLLNWLKLDKDRLDNEIPLAALDDSAENAGLSWFKLEYKDDRNIFALVRSRSVEQQMKISRKVDGQLNFGIAFAAEPHKHVQTGDLLCTIFEITPTQSYPSLSIGSYIMEPILLVAS
jgi:hypothetical protein